MTERPWPPAEPADPRPSGAYPPPTPAGPTPPPGAYPPPAPAPGAYPAQGAYPAAPLGAAAPSPDPFGAPEPVVTPRALTLSIATVTTALLIGGLSLLPLPYGATLPGPTFDTLGEEGGVPLIEVSGAPSYPSEGELRFTTVRVRGGENAPVTVYTLVGGWLDGAVTVLPVEDLLPPDRTPEEIDEQNQALMISSQENATVSALEELGHEVPTVLRVADTVDGTEAAGVVEVGDVVVAVNGRRLVGFSDLSEAMDAVRPGEAVVLTVERDGAEQDLEVVTVDDGSGRALIGVLIDPEFDLPVDVSIQIENVGGPSAGLMFSLGIINVLTEPDETGGEHIAGTGTMDLTGAVGPIGGIVQKMVGSRADGARWFLAPVDNCAEVVGNEPAGLRVVAVATLAEARAAVEAIGAGRADDLPTCADVVGR